VVLSVEELETSFSTADGVARAVRGVSLRVSAGETVALVGESGSGKSVTAASIMRLLPASAAITGGRVLLDDIDLCALDRRALRRIRGRRIAMVFQDSMTSLNPVITIGRQMTEGLSTHLGIRGPAARERAVDLLREVGVPEPEQRLRQYPHQLSGGLRQRIAVAMALAADPELLIADEPTTALDVTVQAQLLDLLRRERERRGMGMILITHDLGIVAGMTDRVCVMYAGRIVEQGPTEVVFAAPRHPYTAGLLRSIPRIDSTIAGRLPSIEGSPPSPWALPAGCPFAPRCERVEERCRVDEPASQPVGPAHVAACWRAEGAGA
jgi:oligopeptide/dipeptide ABC transporter ATP-binding protein